MQPQITKKTGGSLPWLKKVKENGDLNQIKCCGLWVEVFALVSCKGDVGRLKWLVDDAFRTYERKEGKKVYGRRGLSEQQGEIWCS